MTTWLQKNAVSESGGQSKGCSLWARGLILNHSESGVTSGYSHGHAMDLKLKLLNEWSDHVAQLVSPPTPNDALPHPDNVIPIRRSA